MNTEKFNPFFTSGYDGGKVLVEDHGKDRRGKGGVGKVIHDPAEDFTFLDRFLLGEHP